MGGIPTDILPPGSTPGNRKLTPKQQVALVAENLRLFIEPGQVTELRAIKCKEGKYRSFTWSGFYDYDHLNDMAREALRITGMAQAVYFLPNPLDPAILARRANRADRAEEDESAKDQHVLRRHWLLIDVDPVRITKVSATNEEKALAHSVVLDVREYLTGRGWPLPIFCDSGNGYHLLYRIDLPPNDGGLVQGVLKALAQRFDRPDLKIDTATANPARACKLPGTLARKGDDTRDRPHRRGIVLEVPAS